MLIYFVTNEQYARNGSAVSSYIPLTKTPYYTLDEFFNAVENQNLSTSTNITNNVRDAIKDQLNWLGAYNYDCSTVQSGWNYSLYSCINFSDLTRADCDNWNNNYAGRDIEIKLYALFYRNGFYARSPYFRFCKTLPTIDYSQNSGNFTLVSDCCVQSTPSQYQFTRNDFSQYTNPFVDYDFGGNIGVQSLYNSSLTGISNCIDVRNSTGTNQCLITINGLNLVGDSYSNSYTLMFQPDVNNTSGSINVNAWEPLSSIDGVTARFVGGGVRGAGILIIRGTLDGTVLEDVESVPGGTLVPVLRTFHEPCILLQASFSPCCDSPDTMSETYSDVIDGLKGNNLHGLLADVSVDSIEWSGFENLSNYCCDDSDCSNTDTLEFPPNSTIEGGEGGGGEGGGGEGGGTDPCVCEWLESIDGKLGLINSSLGALACICTSLDTLTGVLRGKELSVTNQITVTPSTAQITTPVNAPVTVNPPVNQITVTPSTAQITTPVNAPVTVTPAPVTVNPTDLTGLISAINGLQLSASVTNNIDGLTCENSLGQQESLACIIRDALNYSGEGLAEIHKKAFSFVDCCNNEVNLIDTLVKKDSSECVEYSLVEEVHNLNESVKLSSDDIIIENGLYSDVRKKYFQPFLTVDD